MYRSGNPSPSRSTTPFHGLDEHGIRKFKPLPKRRRLMDFGSHGAGLPYPLTGTQTPGDPPNPSTASSISRDRGWSVTSNFPDIEKVMNLNSSFTREQFIAHAGEFAKRLQHQLQGGRLPSVTGDRMEFVQAFLQQHRDHAAEPSPPQSSSPKASSSEWNIQPPEELTTYSVSVPLLPNAKLDLDAVFSAQFEASLAGAIGSFDRFDECDVLPESWEEVAEIYYSHRPAPPPPSVPVQMPLHMTGATSDLGRRGLRDGEEDEEDEGDGDYDHLRQPGNAKKRKTPANANNSWHSQTRGDADDEGLDNLGGLGGSKGNGTSPEQKEGGGNTGGDQGTDKGGRGPGGSGNGGGLSERMLGSYHDASKPLGRLPLSTLSSFVSSSTSSARVGQLKAIVRARGKLAGAMVAGIQHKEMLKTRKRQLEAVLGVLSSSSLGESGLAGPSALDSTLNSLALDQALTMVGPSPLPVGDSTKFGSAAFADPSAGNRDGHQVAPRSRTKESGKNATVPPIRLSQRTSVRRARVLAKAAGPGPRSTAPLPSSQFTFRCDSVAKERTKAAQDAALKLRHHFETELERQATTAAKLAAASRAANILEAASTSRAGSNSTANPKATKQRKTKTGASPSKNRIANPSSTHGPTPLLKPSGPAQQAAQQQQRQPQANSKSSQKENANPQQQQPASQVSPPPTSSNKPKKKKRSAMANASNPHHLRNYVPSRLPYSSDSHSQGHGGLSGLLGPLPARFLTAELPPRRTNTDTTTPAPVAASIGGKKKRSAGGNNGSGAALAPGSTDEWICMFCEYDLYYGDEVAFRRAVRSRKMVLKRRRRARERAAAAANGMKQYGKTAASGQAPPQPAGATGINGVPNGQSEEEDYELEEDYDGDPGYEQGGNGRDRFGNVPKGQLSSIPSGGGGRGAEVHGTGTRQTVDPAG